MAWNDPQAKQARRNLLFFFGGIVALFFIADSCEKGQKQMALAKCQQMPLDVAVMQLKLKGADGCLARAFEYNGADSIPAIEDALARTRGQLAKCGIARQQQQLDQALAGGDVPKEMLGASADCATARAEADRLESALEYFKQKYGR